MILPANSSVGYRAAYGVWYPQQWFEWAISMVHCEVHG